MGKPWPCYERVTETGKLDEILEDMKDCLVEHEFASRMDKINGYHQIGTLIIEHKPQYGEGFVKQVAGYLNKSERTIQYCVKLVELYENLDTLPEGKDISWSKLVKKYMGGKQAEFKKVKEYECPQCGFKWAK